ncbi:MAG: SufD family Fe-S cluster assembly protein [Thermoplasmata archaeon]|nr:SufD family Fe-S cluster assembly protein [Thermoplasmata archaeon]
MATVVSHSDWLTEASVDALSLSLAEPEAQRALRHHALRAFRDLALEPNPLYRKYGYFAGVDLTGIDPTAVGPPVSLPKAIPGSARIVHDASGTRVELPSDLRESGVTIETAPSAWRPGEASAGAVSPVTPAPEDRLSALAEATINRGYRLTVPDRCPATVRVQEITILSHPREALSVVRSLRFGERTHALVTEEVYGTPDPAALGQSLYASSTNVEVGGETRAAIATIHAPDARTVSIYRRQVRIGRSSRFAWIWGGLGGFRTKVRNRSFLEGDGSDLLDLQTFYGAGEQAYDSAIDMTHLGVGTHGQSVTRGLFRDTARGMSRGLVRIEKDARKTVSYLSEHSMLLSRGARSDTIPILEILCRDVRATHSSSVAPVDPEKVFYLESRGLTEDESIRSIGEGFLANVLERSPIGGLRDAVYPFLAARWEGRPIVWAEGAYPTLPPLELTGTESEPDWRFDAKLR